MEDSLVSVLIPCYNTEKYISRCLELVTVQSYPNLEIIVLNDGSTDNTLNIVSQYREKDNRIRIINRENRGVAASRNELIANSTGEYITFVDSDDFIAKDYIRDMLQAIKETNSDIAICHVENVHSESEIKEKFSSERNVYSSKETLIQYLSIRTFYDYPVAKLFSRKLFENTQFPMNRIYEDSATLFKIYYQIKQSVVLEKAYYFYLVGRENSITTTHYSYKHLHDNYLAIHEKYEFLSQNVPEIINEIRFCYVGNILTLLERATLSQDETVLNSDIITKVKNDLITLYPFMHTTNDKYHILDKYKRACLYLIINRESDLYDKIIKSVNER